jgi:TatD DNase family protein
LRQFAFTRSIIICEIIAVLTDSHCHLDFPEFADDFPELLARAAAAGVTRFVCIGTSLESSRRAVALAEQYPQIFAVAGIHPNAARNAPPEAIAALREIARHPRVVAIGEIGLDYYRLPPPPPDDPHHTAAKSRQAALFEQQLDLAVELGFNAVIHQRNAWDDTLEIIERYTGKLRTVFHCFGEPLPRARQLLALGHLVSFTGIVTFKNAQAVQEVAAKIPADAYMVETDCPYLAPEPHRGQRCEPAYTRFTAERIAALRATSLETIAAQTEAVANGFFRFMV